MIFSEDHFLGRTAVESDLAENSTIYVVRVVIKKISEIETNSR